MKIKFGRKVAQKPTVFLKLVWAMLANWITWQEMTAIMAAELRVYA